MRKFLILVLSLCFINPVLAQQSLEDSFQINIETIPLKSNLNELVKAYNVTLINNSTEPIKIEQGQSNAVDMQLLKRIVENKPMPLSSGIFMGCLIMAPFTLGISLAPALITYPFIRKEKKAREFTKYELNSFTGYNNFPIGSILPAGDAINARILAPVAQTLNYRLVLHTLKTHNYFNKYNSDL